MILIFFACMAILLLMIIVYYMLGRAVCIKGCWKAGILETVCVGFFFYFVLFQIPAEILIFTKQKLHVLRLTWLCILILLLTASAVIIRKEQKKRDIPIRSENSMIIRLLFVLMAAAVVCECAAAVLMQRNIGWDFAYYIGNMTTSAATDTMYLYDGSSGLLRKHIELRYALSAFYMNTAWISQMTGISALVLQKYVMGVLCVLLTNAVVYSFAMEVFRQDKKKTAMLVTLTVILTIFWDVYDTSAQFLMLRSYEAKAYCANVVLPMVLFLLYRIWKDDSDVRSWAELFLTAAASVAVSMSSLVLVPVLIGIMLLAHMLAARRFNWILIRRALYCVLPNLCYLLVYLAYAVDWLAVEV